MMTLLHITDRTSYVSVVLQVLFRYAVAILKYMETLLQSALSSVVMVCVCCVTGVVPLCRCNTQVHGDTVNVNIELCGDGMCLLCYRCCSAMLLQYSSTWRHC